MLEVNKSYSGSNLTAVLEAVLPAVCRNIVLGIASSWFWLKETKELSKILGRAPTEVERLHYRTQIWLRDLEKEGQDRTDALTKIRSAVWSNEY